MVNGKLVDDKEATLDRIKAKEDKAKIDQKRADKESLRKDQNRKRLMHKKCSEDDGDVHDLQDPSLKALADAEPNI